MLSLSCGLVQEESVLLKESSICNVSHIGCFIPLSCYSKNNAKVAVSRHLNDTLKITKFGDAKRLLTASRHL